MTVLSDAERAVLRALRDFRPRAATTIADETGEPNYSVRAALKALRGLRFVSQEWSVRDVPPGSWLITELGHRRLQQSEQMRLIP